MLPVLIMEYVIGEIEAIVGIGQVYASTGTGAQKSALFTDMYKKEERFNDYSRPRGERDAK